MAFDKAALNSACGLLGANDPLLGLAAAGISKFFGGRGCVKRVGLKDDDSYKENVAFIHEQIGDVEISTEFPPIHEKVGLEIGDVAELNEVDGAMALAMKNAVDKVKAKQAKQGEFISFKDLRSIFESEGAGMYHPCPEKTKEPRYGNLVDEKSPFVKLDGAPSIAQMAKAEQIMKETVADATIWPSLKIDTNTIKNIFGKEGIRVRDVDAVFARHEKAAHIAIDVGVVRFPRLNDAYFKLYRFRVIVFRSESAVLFINKKCAGLFCEFREQVYTMDPKFAAGFDKKHTDLARRKMKEAMASLLS